MKRATRTWIRKAEADRVIARQSSRSVVPLHDGVCFHCQQAAEKYLKALMCDSGLPIPKTHDLELLRRLLSIQFPSLRSLRRGLTFLTDFAVDTRYPGANANKRQATAALKWLERVRSSSRALLKMP